MLSPSINKDFTYLHTYLQLYNIKQKPLKCNFLRILYVNADQHNCFSEKIKFDISCEISSLIFFKRQKLKIKVSSAAILLGYLRVYCMELEMLCISRASIYKLSDPLISKQPHT